MVGRKKGYKHSEETKAKLSANHRSKRGYIHPMKGRKHSEESKLKMRLAKLGKPFLAIKGKPRPDISGKNNWRWAGGEFTRRRGHDWQLIRRQVLIRFEFKCLHCGKKGTLDIHHKTPYREVQEHKLDNLIPLCKPCHMKEEWRMNKRKFNYY